MWEGVTLEEGQGLEIVVTAISEGTTIVPIRETITVVAQDGKNREVVMIEIGSVIVVVIKGGILVLIRSQMSALNVTKKVILLESALRVVTIEEGATKGEMTDETMKVIAGGTTSD